MNKRENEYEDFSQTPFYKQFMKLIIPYSLTPEKVAKRMLELAKVTSEDIVVDLGCGEGDLLILAAKEYGCKCVGYEIDEELYKRAIEKVRKHNLSNKVKIYNKDLFKADLSNVDVVLLYLTPRGLELLKPKLEKELKKGARIVSHDYPIPEWRYKIVEFIPSQGPHVHAVYLYIKDC